MSKCLLMTLILYYFRIYFIPYDQIRWETNSLYLEVQISLNLCIFESCISLLPSFPSFLVFPGRVMGFPLSVKIILCKFHNTSDLSFFFFTSFSRRLWLLGGIFYFFTTYVWLWTAACQASLSFTISRSLLKLMSIKHLNVPLLYNESVTKENTLILALSC